MGTNTKEALYITISFFALILLTIIIYVIFNTMKDKKDLRILASLSDKELNTIKNRFKKITSKKAAILCNISFVIVLLPLLAYCMYYTISTYDTNLVIVLFTVLIIMIIIARNMRKEYTEEYKNKIIKKMVKEIDPSLFYYPNKRIDEQLYINSDLDHYDKYTSNDMFEGKINNLDFFMADVKTQIIIKDSKNRAINIPSFTGVFAYTSFPSIISEEILITTLKKYITKNNRLLTKNDDFNKLFTIKAFNKEIAKQLLTKEVMDALLLFYKESNINIEISIQKDIIYFRFSTGDLYEPKMRSNKEEAKRVYIYKCILSNMEKIIKEISNSVNNLKI